LPYLGIPDPSAFLIVETDALDLGYEGILKQKNFSLLKRTNCQISFWNLAYIITKVLYH